MDREVVIVPYRDGPYLVRGPVAMRDQRGNPILLVRDTIALCRCGRSQTRPFCDGTHRAIDFRAPSEIEREPTSGYQGNGPAGSDAARSAAARSVRAKDHQAGNGADVRNGSPVADEALQRAADAAKMIPGDMGRRARALIAGAVALSERAACDADPVAPLALLADAVQTITGDGPVNDVHRRRVLAELRIATCALKARHDR